jgi:hypothetical protein
MIYKYLAFRGTVREFRRWLKLTLLLNSST